MTTHALKLNAHLDVDGIEIAKETSAHLVVRIDPVGVGVEADRPALSVIFALDVSGSMSGPPLEHVVQAVGKLVELLDPADRVGVVAFSDGAAEVCPLHALDAETRQLIKRRVRRLETQGCTSIEAGLRAAAGMLPRRAEGERQIVLLLSDGAPNVGISDIDGLAGLVAAMRPDVTVSTLGFGPHHNEDILAAIAAAGAGQYATIAAPLECDYEFARALGAQGDVVADGIELTIKPEDGVEIDALLSHQRTRITAGGLLVSLPDAMEGRPQFVVARLTLKAPRAAGPWEALEVGLSYRIAGQRRALSTEARLVVPVRHQPGRLIPERHGRVLLAEAERARQEARALADRGHFDGAAAVLRKIIARIEAAEGFRAGDGSDLSEAVEQLIDEAMAYERRPSQEEYKDFRRVSLGVDMQSGGLHGSDRALTSAKGQAIHVGTMMAGGALPVAFLLVRVPGAPERLVALDGPEISIGRTPHNDVVIPQVSFSKRQLRIIGHGGRYILTDLKSTNGTALNGQRLSAPAILTHGDLIQVGDTAMEYRER